MASFVTFLRDFLGSVVRRPISATPRLNFNLGFFIPSLKCLFRIIFCVLIGASNSHILDKRIRLNFVLKLSGLKSDFTLILGYLNPALNNLALDSLYAVYLLFSLVALSLYIQPIFN